MKRVLRPVDGTRTRRHAVGTTANNVRPPLSVVDTTLLRPRSVLTRDVALTCDDARRPQYPQALLRPLDLSQEERFFVEGVDDAPSRTSNAQRRGTT